ncbi:MAG: hypothetical protein LBS85_07275 [Clostridiales Family XIII bacterium]|nr:hypothetical protein [Clostridiales Family XIII bacterium]
MAAVAAGTAKAAPAPVAAAMAAAMTLSAGSLTGPRIRLPRLPRPLHPAAGFPPISPRSTTGTTICRFEPANRNRSNEAK